VILTITDLAGKENTGSFHFAIEEIATDYSVNLEFQLKSEAGRTHPWMLHWAGSEMGDLPITLNLAADALRDVQGVTTIADGNDLVDVCERLHNLALPALSTHARLPTTAVSISDGSSKAWFYRRGVISKVSCVFKPPWDLRNGGKPMVAEVKLVLRHHFGATTDRDPETKNVKSLPHRPWVFSKMWGMGSR